MWNDKQSVCHFCTSNYSADQYKILGTFDPEKSIVPKGRKKASKAVGKILVTLKVNTISKILLILKDITNFQSVSITIKKISAIYVKIHVYTSTVSF